MCLFEPDTFVHMCGYVHRYTYTFGFYSFGMFFVYNPSKLFYVFRGRERERESEKIKQNKIVHRLSTEKENERHIETGPSSTYAAVRSECGFGLKA